MLNEFGPYATALDPNVNKTDQTRKLILADHYGNNGVPSARPMPSTDIPRANLTVTPTAWNYNSYLGNFYNYYTNQPYDLGEVQQQYPSQKCGPQFTRNYGHSQPLPSTSVLQCCDPRCQLLSEHTKYPFNQTYCPKSSPRQKHTKGYHNAVLNLPKLEVKPSEHATKYQSCISYSMHSNDLSNKYANQQSTYSPQYQNSIKPPGPVIAPESPSFGEFYTDIGKPAYWNKALWNRNIQGSYYSSSDPNKDIHQKLSSPLLEQNGFIPSNQSSRSILFNRLLESGNRQYDDNAHTANYHSSNCNQLKHDFRPNYIDREYMLTENVHGNTRLSIPNNGYQPQPVYSKHYLVENCIQGTNQKNLSRAIENRSLDNIDRPLEKNSSLDVREFLSTWDDVEDDKPTESVSTESPVIVLDCSSIADAALINSEGKLREKSINNSNSPLSNVVHNNELEPHSRIVGKAAEGINKEGTLSPHASVIQDNSSTIKSIGENKVNSHDEKIALESSHMNSEGWYSNSKKKHDVPYNLLEMTQRFVSSVFNEPERSIGSDSKSNTLTSTSEYNPQNGKCESMKDFAQNEWNMNSNVKKKNNDTSLNDIHCFSTKEIQYNKPEGEETLNKAYTQVAYGYNNSKDQSSHRKDDPYNFHIPKKNNLEFSMHYSKQSDAINGDYQTPKVQDYSLKYKNSVHETHTSYKPAANANLCNGKNYENYNHYYYSDINNCNNYKSSSSNHILNCREESINYVNSIEKNMDNDSAITLVKADLEKSLNEITNQFEQQPLNKNDINDLKHLKNNESYDSQIKFTQVSSASTDKNILMVDKEPSMESMVTAYARDEKDEEMVSAYNSVIQKTGSCGSIDDICENSLLSMPSLSPPTTPKNADSSFIETVKIPIDSSNLTLNDVYENDIIFDTEDPSIPKSSHKDNSIEDSIENDINNIEPHQPLNLALSKNIPKSTRILTSVLKIHETAGVQVQSLEVMNGELFSEKPENSKYHKNNQFDEESTSQENLSSPRVEKIVQPSDTNDINNKGAHTPIHTMYKTCIVSHKKYDEHTEQQKHPFNYENGTKLNSNLELLSSSSETNYAKFESGDNKTESIPKCGKMSLVNETKNDIDTFKSTSMLKDLGGTDIRELDSLTNNQTPNTLGIKLNKPVPNCHNNSDTDFSHFFANNNNSSGSELKQNNNNSNNNNNIDLCKELHHNKETQPHNVNDSDNEGIEPQEYNKDLENYSSKDTNKLLNNNSNNVELQIERNSEDYSIHSNNQNVCYELDRCAVEKTIEKYQYGASSPENEVECVLPCITSSNMGNKENCIQLEACTLTTAVLYNESCNVQKESDSKLEFSSEFKDEGETYGDTSAYSNNGYKKTYDYNVKKNFLITPKKRLKHLKLKKKKFKKFNNGLSIATTQKLSFDTDVTSTFNPYDPSINAKEESSSQHPKQIITSSKNNQSYYQHQTESDKFVEVQNLNSKLFGCIKSDKHSLICTETYTPIKKMKQDIDKRSNSPAEIGRSDNNYKQIEEQFSKSNNENKFFTHNNLQKTNISSSFDYSHKNSTDRPASVKKQKKKYKKKLQFMERNKKYKNLVQSWRNTSIKSPNGYQENKVELVPNYQKLSNKFNHPGELTNSLEYTSIDIHHSQQNWNEELPVKNNFGKGDYSYLEDYNSPGSIINSDCLNSKSITQRKKSGYYNDTFEETDVRESTPVDDFFNIPSVAPTPHCDLGKEDNIEFDSPHQSKFSPSANSEDDSLDMSTSDLTFNAPTPHCDFPLEEDILEENAIKCVSVHSKAPSPNYDFDYNQEKVLSKAPSPCCVLNNLTIDNVENLEQMHINNYQYVAPLSPASSVAPSPQCDIDGILLDDAIDVSHEEAYDHSSKYCDELVSIQNNVPTLKSLALDALNLVDIQIDNLMSNSCNLLEVRVTSECTEIIIHSEDQLLTNGLDSKGERNNDFIPSNKSQEDESILSENYILKSVEEDEDELQCQCLIISSEESVICLRCSMNSSVIINKYDQAECESSLLPTLESTSDNNIDEGEDTQSIVSSQFSTECIEDVFIDQKLDFSPQNTSEYTELMVVDHSTNEIVERSNADETLLKKEYFAISNDVQLKVQLPWKRIFDLNVEGSNTCNSSKQLVLGPAQIEIRSPLQDSELQNVANSQPQRSASVLKVKRLILQPAVNAKGNQNGYHTTKETIMLNGVEKHKYSKVMVKPNTIAVKGILGVPKMVIKKTSYREYRSYLQPNGILQPLVRLNRSRSLDELALKFIQEKTDRFTVNLKDLKENRTCDWKMNFDKHNELVMTSPISESMAADGSEVSLNKSDVFQNAQHAWQDIYDIQDMSVNETILLPKPERHHCLLCHRSYSSEEMYHLHVKSKFHRHLELTQRKTIHAMYRRFTGHICPRLRPLSARERKKMKWKPRSSHRNHFYHQKTPLQITLHKSPEPNPKP